MEECIVCGKEISPRGIVCKECLQFFEWKYGKDFAEHIIYFKEFDKKRFESHSNKARRYKK